MMRKLLLIMMPFLCASQDDAYMLDGSWNIVELEYSATVSGFPFSGEADNAGTWIFNDNDYTYTQNLNFQSDPVTIPIANIEIPSLPIQNNTSGTWELTNNNETLIITNSITSIESPYDVIILTEQVMMINGTLPYSQFFQDVTLDFEFELEMVLEKQENNSLELHQDNSKKIVSVIDPLGRAITKQGIHIIIYDDGSVEKKYLNGHY